MRTFLQQPNSDKFEILIQDGLENWTSQFWNDQYHLYGRSWLYRNEVFNSYHFLVDNIQPEKKADENANAISILTYNTQLMPFYTSPVLHLNHPDYRAQIIPTYITQYDIVILQELFDKDYRETLTEKMKLVYPYHTRVVDKSNGNFLSGGVMIFSRYPIDSEDNIIYQHCEQEDCLANKGAVYARIVKKNKIYHIFGTHLQAKASDRAQSVRKNQLEQLAAYIKQKNIPANQPILIGGDFNIDERTPELATALSVLNVSLPVNKGHPYSVDATVNAMVTNNEKTRLDYVFIDMDHQQPKVSESKVIIMRDLAHSTLWPNFNAFDDAVNFTALDLSDHFALVTQVTF